MLIVGSSDVVKVDLGIHEIAGQDQSLGRMDAAIVEAECDLVVAGIDHNPKTIDQPNRIESTIGDARVPRIAQEVVDAVGANVLPVMISLSKVFHGERASVESTFARFLTSHARSTTSSTSMGLVSLKDPGDLRMTDHLGGQTFVVSTLRQQRVFRGVGEGQVADVVKTGRDFEQLAASIASDPRSARPGCDHGPRLHLGGKDGLEDAVGHGHDAQGVLETRVNGSGIDLITRCELMNAFEPLKRNRVDKTLLQVVKDDEPVNHVSDLMLQSCHSVPCVY